MDKKTIFGTYLTLLIALLASLKWEPFEITLLASILFYITLGFSLFLLIKFILTLLHVRILFDKDKALAQVKIIYRNAKKNGGELFATHIYPIERLPEDSLTSTFSDVKKSLDFHRLIYTDDPVILDKSIRSTFAVQSNFIDVEVLVPASSSFLPKFVWYIFPRINIVSYFCPKTKVSMTSIGLFRIYTERNTKPGEKHITPTIHFFSKNPNLFKKVREYFSSFNYGHFNHFHSIQEYERVKNNLLIQKKFKSFLSRLLFLCDNPNLGILHVSLFGQYASYRKGIFDIGNLKIDYDIDLIIVCEKGKKEKVKSAIVEEKEKLAFETKIVWGPINDVFYNQRESDKLYIDIELFEENSKYYIENSLLGYSIIPSCLSIFQQNESEHRLYKILKIPKTVSTIQERANVLISPSQRKAFIDFRFLVEKNKGDYDPKRVISHLLRNISWLLTGYFEFSYEKTFLNLDTAETNFLSDELIAKSKAYVIENRNLSNEESHNLILDILNTSIKNMTEYLEENNN